MSKSSEVDGGGTSAVATLTALVEALPKIVPIEEGGGAVLED